MTTRVLWVFFVYALILFPLEKCLASMDMSLRTFAAIEHIHPASSPMLAGEYITVWNSDTTYSGSSANNQITIPGTGANYDIFWEEVALPSNNGTATGNGTTLVTFPSPGIYRVYISPGSGTFTQIRFNNGADRHKLLDIEQWGTIEWTSMDRAYLGCTRLDFSATDAPDLSGVTTMSRMFQSCTSISTPTMNSWVVSGVTNMSAMFQVATNFNADISSWNTGSVTTFASMFAGAISFNQDLGGWDTGSLTIATSVFSAATSFDQDISGWDMNGVVSTTSMFNTASVFNQDLSGWDMSTVTSMASMFLNANALDQDFGDWTLNANVSMVNLFNNAGLSCENYDSTLIKWNDNPSTPDNRFLGATSLNFWLGQNARDNLINVKSWTISGDSYFDCNYIPPDYEITTTGGNLFVKDLSGNGDVLYVTDTGGDLVLDVAVRNYSLDGGPYTAFPVSIPMAGITSIEINLEAGDDTVEFDVEDIDLPDLTMNGGLGNDEVILRTLLFLTDANLDLDLQNDEATPGEDNVLFNTASSVKLRGNGNAIIRVSKNVKHNPFSTFTAVNGNLTIEANQQATPTSGSFYGIQLINAFISISGSGKLLVKGKGGDGAVNQMGIYLQSNSQILGGTSGLQEVEGIGGLGSGNSNRGVQVQSGSTISTNGGDLEVTGEGGGVGGLSAYNYGVHVVSDGTISAEGSGTVMVVGKGASSEGVNNHGIHVLNTNSRITSSGGNVTVIGEGGGTGASGHNKGVLVESGGKIWAGGSGAVSVTGTASSTPTGVRNHGVHVVNGGASIYSSGGDVDVIGISGGSGISSNYNHGVMVEGSASITAGGMGEVLVEGTGGTAEGERNDGVTCWNAGATITSGGGDVHVVGLGGGTGTSYWNFGVLLDNGGVLSAGGLGNLVVDGTGGSNCSGERNYGVYVYLVNSLITSDGGNVTINAQGGGNATSLSNPGILIHYGTVTAGGSGTVMVTGTGGANESDRSDGVHLYQAGATITSSGGDVTVIGQGGGLNNTNMNYGVLLYNDCIITAGGSGNVLVQGTGGLTGGTRNDGVYLFNTSTITSSGGNVHVIGQGGGTGTGFRNYGVFLMEAGTIVGQGNGTVTVEGTGASSSGIRNYGVVLENITSYISSANGDVFVTGQGGGSGTSGENYGVYLTTASISAGGTGNIFIDGTGGTGTAANNYGVNVLGSASSITTNNGNIDILGLGGGVGASIYNIGVLNRGTIMAGGSGEVNIDGTGGPATGGNNHGVYAESVNCLITTMGGDLNIQGQGGGSANSGSNYGISVLTGATIEAGGMGNTAIHGTGGQTAGSTNFGVAIASSGTTVSSNGGDVVMTGQGGGDAGSGAHNYGVNINNAGQVSVGGTGSIQINATGGPSTGNFNYGILVFASAASITSNDGDININAQGGGSDSSGSNNGVYITSQGLIMAGGTGNVNITSTGGITSGGFNYGIRISGNGTFVQSANGNLVLNGTGGGTGASNNGIGVLVLDGLVAAGGAGQVNLNGTGGSSGGNNNYGVQTTGMTAEVTSAGGDIVINGTEGGGTNSYGLTHDDGADITTLNNSGNIFLTANSMNIDAPVSLSATDTVFIKPLTAGIEITLGPIGNLSGGPLFLADAELDSIDAVTMYIGDATSGTITIDSNITRPLTTNMAFISNEDILISGGSLNTEGGNVFLDPGNSPFAVLPIHYETDIDCGTLTFGSDLAMTIDGTVADTTYTVLTVRGEVDLSGVDLVLSGSYVPQGGEVFTIIQNDASEPIIATFTGLPEGASIPAFLGGSYPASITYLGGSGNDVEITVSSPDYIITNANNKLTITDVAGNGEAMTISETGANIAFAVTGRSYSLNGAILTNFPVNLGIAGLDTIEINLEEGDDILTTSSFVTPFPNFRVNGGIGDDYLQIYGNINFQPSASFDLDLQNDDPNPGNDEIRFSSGADIILSDTGHIVIRASMNLFMLSGTRLQTEDGDITIEMNMQTIPSSGNFTGVYLTNAAIEVTGLGELSIQSRGGMDSGSQYGIYFGSGSTVLGGTDGITQIEGFGGASIYQFNYGVAVQGAGTLLSTNGSDIHITGTGGGMGASSWTNYGVHVVLGAIISAGDSGTVHVQGFGGGGEGTFNIGVRLGPSNSTITSSGGDVVVEGAGGNLSTDNWNYGVLLYENSQITAGGTGSVSVTGTGGASTGFANIGVVVEGDSAIISSQGGDVEVIGFGGGLGSSTSNAGVYVRNEGSISSALSGSLIVTGTGGVTTGNGNHGIYFRDSGTFIATDDANLTLIGNGGGTGSSENNYGVYFNDATATAGGIGNLLIDGTGGPSEGGENYGLYVTGASALITTMGGDLNLQGQGGGSADANQNYGAYFSSGAIVEAGGMGTTTVQGTGGQTSGGANYGVGLTGIGTSLSSNGGDVMIIGQGGGGAGSGVSNFGVYVANSSLISVGGTGHLQIDATGGDSGGGNNQGLYIFNAASVTSTNGDILVNGQGGGNGSGGSNMGVNFTNQGSMTAGGTGDIYITSLGGNTSGSSNFGIRLFHNGSLIQTTDGNITLNGSGGGSASSGTGVGIYIFDALVSAGSSGQINLTGVGATAGGSNNYGVHIDGPNGIVTTAGGDIRIQGTEGGGPSGFGIFHEDDAEITTMNGSGNIFLTANSMNIEAPVNLSAMDTIFIQPLSSGVEVKLGPGNNPIGGPLHLSDAELDFINATNMHIGNDTCGTITISSNITRPVATNIALISAGDVIFNTGNLNTGGGNLFLDPGLSPFGVYPLVGSQDVIADTLTFGSNLIISIDGIIPDTEYDQMNLSGVIDLTGVELILQGSYIPMQGDSFVIIQNDDMEAIIGTFVGLMEGDTIFDFLGDTLDAYITYVGHTGNDAVIRVINQCLISEIPILSASIDTACAGEIITLTVDSGSLGDATDWYWYSDDCGLTPEGTGTSIMVSPMVSTTYFVRGEGGCVTNGPCAEIDITINEIPDASIDQNASGPCYFTDNTFQPVATEIPGATYQWNFGMNAIPASAVGYGPHTVYYTSPGSKTVKLVIYPNEAGVQCPDSSSIDIVITSCPAQILGKVLSTSDQPIASVNIRLFVDANADGMADTTVAIRSVFTPSNGSYAMAALTPGHYVIVQSQPTGWTSFDDGDSTDDGDVVPNIDPLDNLIPVTLLPLEVDSMNIFREKPNPGQISGNVFNDFDVDQFPDAGEGIADVTVELYEDNNADGIADSGTPIKTEASDAQGYFLFDSIVVGHYVLVEIQPPGLISIKDFDASNDGDVVPNTNMVNDTIPVTIINGELDAHNYFIDVPSCGLMVTNTNDSGPGSFREALNCGTNGDTIRFHSTLAGMTIDISSGILTIADTLTIVSSLMPTVTIQSQITGMFEIQTTGAVEFRNFDIISGLSPGGTGAAFENHGSLKLHNMTVLRNPLFASGEYLIRNHTTGEIILSGSTAIEMN